MALVEKTVPALWRSARDELVLDWSALEPGDDVAFLADTRSYYGSRVVYYTVERVTATQIIMEDGSRWYRKNGQQVAGQSSEALRHPQDDEVLNSLLASEDRLFKRALEDLAKRRTTTQEQRLRDKQDAEKIAAGYGARLLALEGQRRPRAEV